MIDQTNSSANDCDEVSPNVKILAKLRALAEATAVPPSWYDACMKLTDTSTDEERMAVYQADWYLHTHCGVTRPDHVNCIPAPPAI